MSIDEIQWGELWIAEREDTVIRFEHDPRRAAQVVPLIESGTPSLRDMQNTTNTFLIAVLREHENVSAARAFILAHAKAIEALDGSPRSLRLRYHASPVTEYIAASALLTAYPSSQKGVSTTHTYSFTAGAIS